MPEISSLFPARLMTRDIDEHGGVRRKQTTHGNTPLREMHPAVGETDRQTETKAEEKVCASLV